MILDEIIEKKKIRLKRDQYVSNKTEVSRNSLYNKLKDEGLCIIGELKKASPSKGVIDQEFNYCSILKAYNKCVDSISVLTEEDYFLGNKEYLIEAKRNSSLPILRKDFIINEKQILESYNLGADAILLIVSILSDQQLKKFYKYATSLGLDSIIEVHNKKELLRALKIKPNIIGINNRNLKDFTVNLETTVKLKELIPDEILIISESGIKNRDDIKKIGKVDGVLIGESFMLSQDKFLLAKELKKAYEYAD